MIATLARNLGSTFQCHGLFVPRLYNWPRTNQWTCRTCAGGAHDWINGLGNPERTKTIATRSIVYIETDILWYTHFLFKIIIIIIVLIYFRDKNKLYPNLFSAWYNFGIFHFFRRNTAGYAWRCVEVPTSESWNRWRTRWSSLKPEMGCLFNGDVNCIVMNFREF